MYGPLAPIRDQEIGHAESSVGTVVGAVTAVAAVGAVATGLASIFASPKDRKALLSIAGVLIAGASILRQV